MRRQWLYLTLGLLAMAALSGCGGGGGGQIANGPWIGEWVQVNFLAESDNGVWGADDPGGIGFVADITATTWTETDNYGSGASYTATYTVGNGYRHRKVFNIGGTSVVESGHLEFSPDGNTMTEWYDMQPGDTITAFRWRRVN